MNITDLLAWLVAFALLLLVVWGLIVIIKAAFFEKDLVIAPFYITGREDAEGRLARSLALMLQARLRQVQREFEVSQGELISSKASATKAALDSRVVLTPRFISQPVTLS